MCARELISKECWVGRGWTLDRRLTGKTIIKRLQKGVAAMLVAGLAFTKDPDLLIAPFEDG